MNCIEVELKLQAYFDNELPKSLDSKIDAHLARCRSCRQELHKLTFDIRNLLHAVHTAPVSVQWIKEKIAQITRQEKPRHPLPMAPISLTLCLCLAAGMGILLFLQDDLSSKTLSSYRLPSKAIEKPLATHARLQIFSLHKGFDATKLPKIQLLDLFTCTTQMLRITPQSDCLLIDYCKPGSYQLLMQGQTVAELQLQAGDNPDLIVDFSDL